MYAFDSFSFAHDFDSDSVSRSIFLFNWRFPAKCRRAVRRCGRCAAQRAAFFVRF